MNLWERLPEILRNSIILTAFFIILFGVLEFSRRQDIIFVFQSVFKPKYRQTYIIVFISALVLQVIIFPLIKLIF